MVRLDDRVRPCANVMFREVGDEAVVLELESGRYFGMDPVGARMWQLLVTRQSLAEVRTALCDEFDAPSEQLERDLVDFVATLQARGLLQLEPDDG